MIEYRISREALKRKNFKDYKKTYINDAKLEFKALKPALIEHLRDMLQKGNL